MLELTELTGALSAASDPKVIMQRVVEQAIDMIAPARGAIVGMPVDGDLTNVCASGTLVELVGTRPGPQRSLSAAAMSSGETLWCRDADGDDRVDAESFRSNDAVSAVSVPLLHHGQPIGVLTITAPSTDAFAAADIDTLTRLAGFISIAIGAMSDLSRITRELLDPGGARVPLEHERMGYFMANVLRPGLVSDLTVRQRIEHVLNEPGLTMRCQPIVDMSTGDLVGAEALARFPRLSQPPDVWFSEADRAGLGPQLQLAAVRVAVELLDELPPDAFLAINVGPDVIAAPELLDILDLVDAGRIVLELTEHLRIEDYPSLHAWLRTIRERGVRLAIDDTGAGFSTLSHIVNLGPELIKLDRQFTRGIDADPARRAMAHALVGFAREVGAEVVSEGIETPAELETVRELGIPYGQGFYIGRPMPVALLAPNFAHAVSGPAGARL